MTPLLAAKDLTTYYGLNPNFNNIEQYIELNELGDTNEFVPEEEVSMDQFSAIEDFVTEAYSRGVQLDPKEAERARKYYGGI